MTQQTFEDMMTRLEAQRREGERRKTEAIDRVERAHKEFVDQAVGLVFQLAQEVDEFTTDDLWAALDRLMIDRPPEPRAIGAAMRAAKAAGYAEPTDRTKLSLRPCCHRRPVRVWRSLLRGK